MDKDAPQCELCSSNNVVLLKYYDYFLKDKLKNNIKRVINTLTFSNRYKIVKQHDVFKAVKIVKCSDCSFAATYPKVTLEDLDTYYSSHQVYAKRDKLDREIPGPRPMSNFNYLSEHIPLQRIDSVIEFGAAGAETSRLIASKNNLTQIAAVEPIDNWHKLYNQSKIKINPYYSVFDVKSRYSLLVASHSIEFVADLYANLKKMIEIIKPGGYLFFEVPNCNATWYKVKRRRVPATYFFSTGGIDSLAKKYNLKIVHVGTFGLNFDEDDDQIPIQEKYKINSKGRYLRFVFQTPS